jgi:hypothetical protein
MSPGKHRNMKSAIMLVVLVVLAGSALAAPPYPVEALLLRAKYVFVAQVSGFESGKVSLKVTTRLRGDPETDALTFLFLDITGTEPRNGELFFVFSQGHDQWGQPGDEIKMSQGLDCQGSYCGWIMLPIHSEKGLDIVKNAFSFKFRKPEEGLAPLTLEQVKELVKETKFKAEFSETANKTATGQVVTVRGAVAGSEHAATSGISAGQEAHMSWMTFGQVALLIVIFAFVTTLVKCMHNACCKKCKKE